MSIEEIKLVIVFVLLMSTAGLSSWATHQIDNTSYKDLELHYVQTQEKAVEAALKEQVQLDEVKTQVALEDGQKQRKITNQTKEQLTNVQKYIKRGTVTWDTVQLFNSALLGIPTSSVPVPAGATADTPSRFTTIDLAQSFVNNIGVCKADIQQLNSLIDFYNRAHIVETTLKGDK